MYVNLELTSTSCPEPLCLAGLSWPGPAHDAHASGASSTGSARTLPRGSGRSTVGLDGVSLPPRTVDPSSKMPLGRILDCDGNGDGDGDGDDNEPAGAVATPRRQWRQGIVTAEDHAVRGPKCG